MVATLVTLDPALGPAMALADAWLDRILPRPTAGSSGAAMGYAALTAIGALLGIALVLQATFDPRGRPFGLTMLATGACTLVWWALRMRGRTRPGRTLRWAAGGILVAGTVVGLATVVPDIGRALRGARRGRRRGTGCVHAKVQEPAAKTLRVTAWLVITAVVAFALLAATGGEPDGARDDHHPPDAADLRELHAYAGSDEECSKFDLDAGEAVWHFVLTQTSAGVGTILNVQFDGGAWQTSAATRKTGGTLHWYVFTSGASQLTGAWTSANGGNLNLSHVCSGGTSSSSSSNSWSSDFVPGSSEASGDLGRFGVRRDTDGRDAHASRPFCRERRVRGWSGTGSTR